MSIEGVALPLDVLVERREVKRCLGYRRGRGPKPRIARRLDDLWSRGAELLEPRGAFRFVSRDLALATGMPRPTSSVAVALCTVGPALEREVERASADGHPLDALLLDAFGSAAAEAAADALNRAICTEARAMGIFPGRRLSPGYGKWNVRCQRDLLELLPADKLGVSLTPGMMMLPRKSVSFAVRLELDDPGPEREARRCERCNLESCAFRREPGGQAD